MRSKDELTLLHQPKAVWTNVYLATKISRYTQRLLSIMQSLSPPSYMTARHGSHTAVISGYLCFFHIRRLQLILGHRWWHKVAHSEIRARAGIPSIESMLLNRQLRWLGHVIIMPHSRLPHSVLYDQLRLGHISVGGQKKRFKDHIKSIVKKMQHSISSPSLESIHCGWRRIPLQRWRHNMKMKNPCASEA